MTQNRTKYLDAGLLALSAVALWVSWSNFLPLIQKHGFVGATLVFWDLVRVNEAARFITTDAFVLGVLSCWWLLGEAKRLGMRSAWGYIAASLFIGISFAFPLFLVHRNRLMARLETDRPTVRLSTFDKALMSAITALTFGYMVLKLPH